MSSFINTNINSLIAQQNLATNQSSLTTSITRLSSGLRINSAADDPAGLAISDRMTAQVNGVNQAVMNANNGISLAQTADGAMASTVSALQQIRTLAVEAANATNSASDRQSLNAQANALLQGIQQTATTAQFNGQNLLDGSFGTATFQVGANAGQTVSVSTGNFQTSQYGAQLLGSQSIDTVATGTLGTSTTPSTTAVQGASIAGSIVINGRSSQSITLAATVYTAAQAAAQINTYEATTGVTATATNLSQLDFTNATAGSYTLQVQGDNNVASNVSFDFTGANSAGLQGALQAFNQVSGQTGITATLNAGGTGLLLTDAAGNNIAIGSGSDPAATNPTLQAYDPQNATVSTPAFTTGVPIPAAGVGSSAAVTVGTLQFSSNEGFSVGPGTGTASVLASTTAATSTLSAVNTIDLTTAANATAAIGIVDAAVNTIDAQRAQFGAIESQFNQVVSNLQTTSTNLQSARSEIKDANFAAETANLSRTQILQQAGTAMVAQANQLPQGVLALLK